MKQYIKNHASSYNSNNFHTTFFKASISGFCSINQQLEIYYLEPVLSDNNFDIKVTQYTPGATPDDFVLVFGEKCEEIKNEIAQYRQEQPNKDINWWRAPLKILQTIIKENRFDSVGGQVQLGHVVNNKDGYNSYFKVEPIEIGKSDATISYLGFDFYTQMFALGSCYIVMDQMPV